MKLSIAMPFAIAAVALAGCSSSATSTATSSATGQAASRPSAAATAGAPSCTTHACIADDMQKSLVGLIVKDKSIVAKATCRASTVQHHAGNTWTARCTATYVNGTTVSRFADYILGKRKIGFIG